jgi:hypothetical protein
MSVFLTSFWEDYYMNENRMDFYANAVNVLTSLYDVTLNFRTQSPIVAESGKPPMIEAFAECNIRMSPQHAKALAALLVRQILQYEDEFKVNLPVDPNILEFWQKYVRK